MSREPSNGYDPYDFDQVDLEGVLDGEVAAGSYRPSLVVLTRDLRDLRDELLAGFDSRREVLEWLADLAVLALGEVDQVVFRDLGRQLARRPDERQAALLAALFTEESRERDLDQEAVEDLRERLAAVVMSAGRSRAFRQLRTDSTEYIDEAADGDAHDPLRQRHAAMRPAIEELAEWQSLALEAVLRGFDFGEEILAWGDLLDLASHGEIGEEFVSRCILERSTRTLLTEGSDHALESFAAKFVVPSYNQGVRVLRGRAGEVADPDQDPTEATHL